MKRLCTIIFVFSLVFMLCSCRKNSNDLTDGSFYSEPTYNSEISEEINTMDDEDVSNTELSNGVSNDTENSNPSSNESSNDTISSEPVVDDSLKEEIGDSSSENSSPNEPIQGEPQETINFVPNKFHALGSEETYISYYNKVFYKGTTYAVTSGKNNGVDCYAIVTVGNNDEYLGCVAIFDTSNDERTIFNIYNDRIYYIKCVINDARDYTLLNSFSICSMNLSGKDKRIEKDVDLPFTHIESTSFYSDSKYLFFTVSNLFDGAYQIIYKYNIESQELINLSPNEGYKKMIFSIGENVLVYAEYEDVIYQYDTDFNNGKVSYDTKNYAFSGFVSNGFIFIEKGTNIECVFGVSEN